MNTVLVNIGLQKGIILPQNMLAQCKITKDVLIEVNDRSIIISASTPAHKRKGWAKAFKEMAENGDDALVMPDVFHDEIIPVALFYSVAPTFRSGMKSNDTRRL